MTEKIAHFPRPIPEQDAQAFWDGCNREELLMQRCKECGRLRWLPRPMCPHCNSLEQTWVKVSGRGKVYTWTVVTHPVHPAAVDKVPYNVVQVQLDEQPDILMVSNLVSIKNEDIRFDMRVEVVFEELEPGVKLPKFKPAS
tara:strand:+ start:223 stop:645 length:423 start_codon:yes stop_codon:yes gene_type:complete